MPVASLAQLVVGRLIDRMPFKPLQLWMSVAQVPLLIMGRTHRRTGGCSWRIAGGDGIRVRLDSVHRRDDRALCR